MNELNALEPEGRGDSTKKDDIFSKVMGQDKPGHVRMYGLGVCPSDVWDPTPSRTTSHRMNIELRTTLDNMTSRYDELNNKLEEMNNRFIRGAGRVDSPNIQTSFEQRIGNSSSSSGTNQIQVNISMAVFV